MNPRVFWGASVIVCSLLLLAVLAPTPSQAAFQAAQAWVIESFGWFYVVAVAGFVLVVLAVALGPMGRLKLGPEDADPDFPYASWLAMLFAAGMVIGLMYFAVPSLSSTTPPRRTRLRRRRCSSNVTEAFDSRAPCAAF